VDELSEEGFTPTLFDSYWAYYGLLRRIDEGLVGCHGTYPRGLGGLQALVSGPGCSFHLEEGGGMVSWPCGGSGAVIVAASQAEPGSGH